MHNPLKYWCYAVKATELCNRRKGKIKASFFYKGKDHDAYLSHVKVQVTASRKNGYLVLIYGITDSPMILLTNKEIKSKDDVIKIARLYFSRWSIEEYFRAEKQIFQFENFRVRRLKSINTLNMHITLCMAFLAHISMKKETNALKVKILEVAAPLKKKSDFFIIDLLKVFLAYSPSLEKVLRVGSKLSVSGAVSYVSNLLIKK